MENLVDKESLYLLLYSCSNPILRKNLVPEIWAKIFSANQITGFLNKVYLLDKMMKKTPIFCMLIQIDGN